MSNTGWWSKFVGWLSGGTAVNDYNDKVAELIAGQSPASAAATLNKAVEEAPSDLVFDKPPAVETRDALVNLVAESEKLGLYTQPSRNFTWGEVACNDKGKTQPPPELYENVYAAAAMMEEIRSFLGDRRITVNSWYRTPEYNKQVGGAKNSMHLSGKAVDFTVEGLTPKQVFAKLKAGRDSGKLTIGGIGGYAGFVHCDTGKKRTWQG